MQHRVIDRLFGLFVFLYAFGLYVLTVAPTASFWDCGEFIAIANRLQVSHPPGAPFYMLLGRFFSMFVPTAYVSLAVNMMSVVASALTVLFAHYIIVHLIEEFRGDPEEMTFTERLMTLLGGAIGALTFAATDSFWFNAVEAEVYALSMFFTAAVVWLIMRWAILIRREIAESDQPGRRVAFGATTSRYLVVIAYLFGLALGIHLLNLLALFFVALIVFFQVFDKPEWTGTQRFGYLAVTGVVSSLIFFAIYPGVVIYLPDLARATGSGTLTIGLIVGVVLFAIYYTHKNRMAAANVLSIGFMVVLIGYSTYALIIIRSQANPPIDENDPENLEAVVSYLKREQYGSAPITPRMYSPDPNHQRVYATYNSEFDFFLEYQMGEMYWRYFFWNFVGRASDVQGADWTWKPGFMREQPEFRSLTPSEEASRNGYFALPFLLGIIGLVYHIRNDWRRAFSVGILFFVTGAAIILYLNQTPLQPRERDYSFVASFFAYSLWIGLGAYALMEAVRGFGAKNEDDETAEVQEAGGGQLAVYAVAGALFLAVPLWMAIENFDDHDRSGRYIAVDYAHNLLESVEENAVVFTNGDNDTFPLWYAQEVEGLRQDVRVACLSLMNTGWYINQLKNQYSRASTPLPISFADDRIPELQPVGWEPQEISLPVQTERLLGSSEVFVPDYEREQIQSPMTWRLEGRPYSEDFNFLHVADLAALDIIRTNAANGWERPVYFANTTAQSGQLNLQSFFQAEGLAYRIVPIQHDQGIGGRVVPEIALDRFDKFRFTNLNDPDVYYDENIRRMVDNYRITFGHAAEQAAAKGRPADARRVLDRLMTEVPFETIPGDLYSTLILRQAYETVGDIEAAMDISRVAEDYVLQEVIDASSNSQINSLMQYVAALQFAYLENGKFDEASAFTRRLADALGDETQFQTPEQLEDIYGQVYSRRQQVDSAAATP